MDAISKSELEELIREGKENPTTILVSYNDIRPILNVAFSASEKLKEFEVYYQPNLDFYADMEITGFTTAEYYKQAFDDYCNYFDKHKISQITRVNKKLYNHSKNRYESFHDYPEDKKMILLIENFNFWDFNSQSFIAQLSEKNPNIIVIGQLRSDFDFASNHVDTEVRKGKGGATFVTLKD